MRNNDVYKITNKVTGKVYIGITNQGAGARYRHHWYEARIGEPSIPKLWKKQNVYLRKNYFRAIRRV